MEMAPTPNSSLVDMGGLKLEAHVRTAIDEAWRMTRGVPLASADILRAAMLNRRSEAFRELATLFPDASPPPASPDRFSPVNLNAVPLLRPLADSFSVAEKFVSDHRGMWGRDLIAMALLAQNDASLVDLASQSGTTVAGAQQRWLDFVLRSDKHRSADEWRQWWRAAGLSPDGTTPTPVTATATSAYLLTWNPARYGESQLKARIDRHAADAPVSFGWSSGNNQSMEIGERVFLLRQGEAAKRGLVGVGTVIGAPEQRPHWDVARRAEGHQSWIVDVRWEAIDVDPMVEVSMLKQETGVERLWSTPVGGVSIDPQTWSHLERLWPSAWERHRLALDPLRTPPPLAARRLIASFDPDRGNPFDSLNIDRYVDAFARVAASKALKPPLSVGLFGDWGSGKSFFMDRVHERIEALTNPDSRDEDEGTLYLRNVCQIRFNAWHYAETDLWASLVSTLFNELRRYLEGPDADGDEFNKLLNELEIATALQAEAQQQLDAARRSLRSATEAVDRAETELDNLPPPKPMTDTELRSILGKTVKVAFQGTGTGPDRLVTELSNLLHDAYELTGRAEFEEARRGIEIGKTTVEQASRLVADTRAVASRAGFWWRLMAAAKLPTTPHFWALVMAAVAIPFVFVIVQRSLDVQIGWAAGLFEAVTVVAAAATWARTTLSRAAPMMNRLDWIQAAIEREIEEAKAKDQKQFETDRDAAAQQEARARRAVEEAHDQLRLASEHAGAAEEALRESRSDARLGKFIRERATSSDYAQYLGLIAMIHRDFETMSALMERASSGDGSGLPRVDRIVLYIDDLDRCYPPERVVRVLEAVHLLLFFPLFVVFVGVDSRWVSRSLNRYYEHMLSDESLQPTTDPVSSQRAPANSQDFLEKIFQVPFWLRRMDPPAVQRMIHSLITAAEIEAADAPIPEPTGEGPSAEAQDGAPPPVPQQPPHEPGRAAAQTVASEAEFGSTALGEPLAPPTEALRISQAELDFMDKVAPLMPRTPRSVKRFVNIYRLYKATLSTPALARFLGTPEHAGNFRAVQVLLALVIGAPDFAESVVSVLDGISETDARALSGLPEQIQEPSPTWKTTLDAVAKFAHGDDDLRLTELREVSPLVTRYSVHHMVSALPGESTLG